MKRDEHISTSDWIAYFSGRGHTPGREELKREILGHILVCERCRAFYECSAKLQRATEELAALSSSAATDSAAYLAVASPESTWPKREMEGSLCVCIDCQADGAVFIADTLEQNGCAIKYAMNPESNDRTLTDDGDALSLALSNNLLSVTLSEPAETVSWQLFTDNPEGEHSGQLEGNGHPVAISLPRDGLCTFEIRFGK